MSNSKDIIVKLRLLVKPPINIKNFFYKVTYTKFGYQNEDGSHISPKTINHALTKFTVNPSANKNGLLAIDSEAIVLLQHNSNIKKSLFLIQKMAALGFRLKTDLMAKLLEKTSTHNGHIGTNKKYLNTNGTLQAQKIVPLLILKKNNRLNKNAHIPWMEQLRLQNISLMKLRRM